MADLRSELFRWLIASPLPPSERAAAEANLRWWLDQGYTRTRGHVCLDRLARGGCRRYCQGTALGCWDHVTGWNRDGRFAAIVTQPYGFSAQEEHALALACTALNLHYDVHADRSWWYPGSTTCIVVRRVHELSPKVVVRLSPEIRARVAASNRWPEGRVCFVCQHPVIPAYDGTYHADLGIVTHRGSCAGLVNDRSRCHDRSPRGRWRPRNEVLRLIVETAESLA